MNKNTADPSLHTEKATYINDGENFLPIKYNLLTWSLLNSSTQIETLEQSE